MKKKRLKDAILLALEKAIDGYVRIDDFINNPGLYAYHGGWEYPLKKSALASALARLREKGYLEKEKNEGKIIYKLTQAGRDFLIKNKTDDEIEWDGVWRLVIFDIPESHKRVRNVLRRRLKEWSFQIWQKSVWATKKPLTGALRGLTKELGVEDWVLVIESQNTGK